MIRDVKTATKDTELLERDQGGGGRLEQHVTAASTHRRFSPGPHQHVKNVTINREREEVQGNKTTLRREQVQPRAGPSAQDVFTSFNVEETMWLQKEVIQTSYF